MLFVYNANRFQIITLKKCSLKPLINSVKLMFVTFLVSASLFILICVYTNLQLYEITKV